MIHDENREQNKRHLQKINQNLLSKVSFFVLGNLVHSQRNITDDAKED